MAIGTIEIMCPPCGKCARVKSMIASIIKEIEMRNRIKITYSLIHTPHLKNVSNYAVNASQAPVVLINGAVEFTGQASLNLLKMKLEQIHKIA
ncbi:thioredoxin family protein [Candidatus Omnitrophota bacterium]